MPSAICYRQAAHEQWVEHFCLVRRTPVMTTADEASAVAEADIEAALEVKQQGGSDRDVAEYLRVRGYVRVEDFRRATD